MKYRLIMIMSHKSEREIKKEIDRATYSDRETQRERERVEEKEREREQKRKRLNFALQQYR